jgi:hypothetical protein
MLPSRAQVAQAIRNSIESMGSLQVGAGMAQLAGAARSPYNWCRVTGTDPRLLSTEYGLPSNLRRAQL